MADLKFNILEEFGTLSTSKSGWELQLNFVQWGDNQPKFDLRTWSPDHKKMGKGLTLNHDELVNLQDAIEKVLAPEQVAGSQSQASIVVETDADDEEDEKPAWGKLSDM
ncbi:YdbC family protein [Weissella minor]|uniref:YdbC family protein n=1 Tax=Weissella minor TaxID=1620 RepID=UPI003AF2A0AA